MIGNFSLKSGLKTSHKSQHNSTLPDETHAGGLNFTSNEQMHQINCSHNSF